MITYCYFKLTLLFKLKKQQHFLQLWQQLSFTLTTWTYQRLSQKLWLILQYTFCLTFNFIQINHFLRQHSKKFVNLYYIWTFKSDIKQLVLPNRHMVTNYNSHVSVQLPTAWAIAELRLNTMDEISLKRSRKTLDFISISKFLVIFFRSMCKLIITKKLKRLY